MVKGLNIRLYFIVCFLIFFTGTSFVSKNKDILIKYKIYQYGKYGDMYSITIFDNHTIKASFQEIDLNMKYQIIEQQKSFVSTDDFNRLLEIMQKLSNNKFKKVNECADCWIFDFKIGRKRYNYNWSHQTPLLEELFEHIKKISPLEIELYWGGTRPDSN